MRRPSQDGNAPGQDVKLVLVVVERRELLTKDVERELGLVRLERLEKALLADDKLDDLSRRRKGGVSCGTTHQRRRKDSRSGCTSRRWAMR